MNQKLKSVFKKILKTFGINITRRPQIKSNEITEKIVINSFSNYWYIRHNQRRQEHLASLNLDLFDKTVLEVGAGIGDHSSFWVDRSCKLLITEARIENLNLIKERFPDEQVQQLNLDDHYLPDNLGHFDIVYCYGLLYHLKN